MCIEVDLAKPFLSKLRLHGKVWRIQYEGLRLIYFKRRKIVRKEDSCPILSNENGGSDEKAREGLQDPTTIIPVDRPKYMEDYRS